VGEHELNGSTVLVTDEKLKGQAFLKDLSEAKVCSVSEDSSEAEVQCSATVADQKMQAWRIVSSTEVCLYCRMHMLRNKTCILERPLSGCYPRCFST